MNYGSILCWIPDCKGESFTEMDEKRKIEREGLGLERDLATRLQLRKVPFLDKSIHNDFLESKNECIRKANFANVQDLLHPTSTSTLSHLSLSCHSPSDSPLSTDSLQHCRPTLFQSFILTSDAGRFKVLFTSFWDVRIGNDTRSSTGSV